VGPRSVDVEGSQLGGYGVREKGLALLLSALWVGGGGYTGLVLPSLKLPFYPRTDGYYPHSPPR
jgi:hypothetical protein